MSGISNMLITEQGLIKVSKELIAQRAFNSALLTKVGNLSIASTGEAKSFDVDNYAYYSGLNFSGGSTLKVEVEGLYVGNSNAYETMWSLHGPNIDSLTLRVYSNKVSLYLGNVELSRIIVSPSYDDLLAVSVELSASTVKIVLFKNGIPYSDTTTLSQTINITGYTTLYIGTDGAGGTYYWYSTLNLAKLIVYKNDSIYYAPSDANNFHFSKLLISDGEYELTDSTAPIVDHVYQIDIASVTPTKGGVIIKAQVEEDVYLNIKEIGLYEDGGNEEILFATAGNMSIQKTSDLYYDLFFYINIYLNVVNTVAFPEIIVKEEELAKHSDLEEIQKVLLYVETNLERKIKKNNKATLKELYLHIDETDNAWVLERNVDTSMVEYETIEDYMLGQNPSDVYYYGWAKSWCEPESENETITIDGEDYIVEFLYSTTETPDVEDTTGNGLYKHVRVPYPVQELPEVEGIKLYYVENPNPDYDSSQPVDIDTNPKNLEPVEVDLFIPVQLPTSNNIYKDVKTSAGAGDHLPQQFGQLEDKISMQQDNCIGTHNYAKFKGSLNIKEKATFNPYLFTGHLVESSPSTVILAEDGSASGFNTSNFYFITSDYASGMYDSLVFEGSITVAQDTRTMQNIAVYESNITNQDSLKVYLSSGGLYASGSMLQHLEITISGYSTYRYFRSKTDDISVITYYDPVGSPRTDGVKYYAWVNEEWTSDFPSAVPRILYTATELPSVLATTIPVYIGGYCNVGEAPAGSLEYVAYEYNQNYDQTQPESASNPFYILTNTEAYFISPAGTSKTDYGRGLLFTGKICDVIPNRKYYYRIVSDGSTIECYYKYREKDSYTLGYEYDIYEITGAKNWLDNYICCSIGARAVYTTDDYSDVSGEFPFFGSIYLMDYKLTVRTQSDSDDPQTFVMSFTASEEIGTDLLCYYHFPYYPYGAYNILDLSNFDNKLKVVDTSFISNTDVIDFNSNGGNTLCVKINLEGNIPQKDDSGNYSSYTILAKINPDDEDDFYFRLYMDGMSLKFMLKTDYDTLILQKEFTNSSIQTYLNNNILVTIASDYNGGSPKYDMYVNNVLVDTQYLNGNTEVIGGLDVNSFGYYDASNYYLTNYLPSEKADSLNYIKDVMFLNRALDSADLYLINNVLDTNFGDVFNIFVSPVDLTDLTLTCDNNNLVKTLEDFTREGGFLVCKLYAPFYNISDNVYLSSTGYADGSVHLKDLAKVNNFYVTLHPLD